MLLLKTLFVPSPSLKLIVPHPLQLMLTVLSIYIQNLLINDVDSSDNVPVCAENEGESAELEERSKNGHVGEP